MSVSVIHLLPELEQGGVEDHVIALANEQARQGVRVAVISAGGRLVERLDDAVEHIALPVGKKNLITGISCARKVAMIARRLGAQVLHAHSRVPAWVAWFAKKFLPSLKFVYTVHAIFSKNSGTWPIGRADAAICVSKCVRDDLMYRFARVPIVRVIYNALTKEIVPWRGSGERTRLAYAGRLTPKKNLATIIEALAKITGERWTLDVYGEGDKRDELKARAEALGISDRVVFNGYVGDISSRLAECGLFLFPSKNEGFGLSLAEALTAGMPVIASDISASREILTGCELIAPEDVDAWASAISRWLRGDLRADETRLSIEIPTARENAEQVAEVYEKVLSIADL